MERKNFGTLDGSFPTLDKDPVEITDFTKYQRRFSKGAVEKLTGMDITELDEATCRERCRKKCSGCGSCRDLDRPVEEIEFGVIKI